MVIRLGPAPASDVIGLSLDVSHLLPRRPMELTPKVVATLTLPPGKADALFPDDAVPGLALRLRAGGNRGWTFQYRIGRKQRRMSLGDASAISLHAVRKVASQLHARVKLGQDPAGEKHAAHVRAGETFGALLPQYLARRRDRLRPRAYVEVERHLAVHAKRLHGMPLASIARRDVAMVLSAVAAKLSAASANRVRSSLSGMLMWAVREGLIETNHAAWTEKREEALRTRLLSDSELRAIWSALPEGDYGDVVRLLILCAARREELGALSCHEVDLERALISLPAARVKNKRPREIALNEPAVAILKARREKNTGQRDLVFGQRGAHGFRDWSKQKQLLDQRIRAAGVEMPAWTLHDFRRLASTTMHERLSIQPHVVESCLGHVGHQRGTAGRYNLALYRADKAMAAARWGEFVMSVVEQRETKIVPIHA
jgi:integrase